MQEFDDEDTLRQPAIAYKLHNKKTTGNEVATQSAPENPEVGEAHDNEVFEPITDNKLQIEDTLAPHFDDNWGDVDFLADEEDFFDFDTIPRSKVVLPILDDELEDTLSTPAVIPGAPAARKAKPWITGDGKRIIFARVLRMFGFGFSSVLIGVNLTSAGMSLEQVSFLLTTALFGSVAAVIFVTLFADRLGRRRVLIYFALLMAFAGLAFALSQNIYILLVAAFLGTMNPTSTTENTPFVAVEQAMLPQTCIPDRLTDAFARYNLLAQLAGAAGGLVVTLPDILHGLLGLPTNTAIRSTFGLYALLGIIIALLYVTMTAHVELPAQEKASTGTQKQEKQRMSLRKTVRSNIFRLSSLFVLDAFAGGLVIQSLIAFWFRQRFDVSLSTLGILFSAANLLAAFSLPIAARLSKRFGLLKTMVFTHLPSQILLILVPLMPTFWLAALFLLCRQSLSKMDVPTRQVYIMKLVKPEQRTSAAGITTLARSIATSMSPLAAGALLANSLFVLGLPFLVGGGLSSLYDILLYALFRKIPIEDK